MDIGSCWNIWEGTFVGSEVAIKIVTIPDGHVKRETQKEVEILKSCCSILVFTIK